MSSEIPLKSAPDAAPSKPANKAQKEAQKIKEMHDAQLRLALAAREAERTPGGNAGGTGERRGERERRARDFRDALEQMIKECAPGETFDEDVKTALLHLADDFVEEVATQSHRLAKLRNADVIDVKDVALRPRASGTCVVRGTSGEELKPYKRPQKPGTQVQREMKVRKSMARAVEANILQEKERRREERRLAKLQRQAQAGSGRARRRRARAIQAAGATRIKRAKNNTHTHTHRVCV